MLKSMMMILAGGSAMLMSMLQANAVEAVVDTGTIVQNNVIEGIVVTTPVQKATSLTFSYQKPSVGEKPDKTLPSLVKTLEVDAQERPSLSQFQKGDGVDLVVDNVETPKKILSVGFTRKSIPWTTVAFSVGGSAVVLLLVLFAMMRANPLRLALGADNRYSKSKAQMAFWGLTVISVYLGTVFLRFQYLGGNFIGGVEIPTNLLVLSGLSVFSFGAAKAITSAKVNAAVQEAVTPADKAIAAKQTKPADTATGGRPLTRFFDDLVKDDAGNFDLGDTQMVLITGIVVTLFMFDSIYFLQSLALQVHATLPDVDTTLLSAFGLGQGAYLFKKAAATPGAG